jgi:hypothetical protein
MRIVFACAMLTIASTPLAAQPDAARRAAESRAVQFLAAEVPRWHREHPCYSCHNNGDAARALIAASAKGFEAGDALRDTLQWISTPERWDGNESRGGSEDLPLARIQFASALAALARIGRASPEAIDQAATRVVSHQRADGSWRLSDTQLLGGATFYGPALATTMARASIAGSRAEGVRAAVLKANTWLRTAPVATVLDASSIVLGLERDTGSAAAVQRRRALEVLKRGQASDGGWGPYVSSQSEPFDTALAILALSVVRQIPGGESPMTREEVSAAVDRGRAYLLSVQQDDGSWLETTRPPGGESYAQRVSTSAWALLALLE